MPRENIDVWKETGVVKGSKENIKVPEPGPFIMLGLMIAAIIWLLKHNL